jgi:hypothetical protein
MTLHAAEAADVARELRTDSDAACEGKGRGSGSAG